jgi:hypothetical protein
MDNDIEYISIWRRLGRNIRKPINTSAVIILSAYTFVWGLWIALPFWEVFTSADLYSYLALYTSEPSLGIVAMIVAVIMAWGVLKNSFGALTRGAFVGFIFWIVVAIAYFLGDWHNTGGITSLTFAVYSAFIYLNIKVNRPNLHLNESEDTI